MLDEPLPWQKAQGVKKFDATAEGESFMNFMAEQGSM